MKSRIALVLAVVALSVMSFANVGYSVAGGSLSFNGTNQYVSVAGSSDWAVGTGDFTVEWFQYQTSTSDNPRVFSVGTYPSASIGVSVEGGRIYVWLDGGWRLYAPLGTISNRWVHFAISRTGSTLRIFKDGTELASGTNTTNVSNSSSLMTIGSEASSGTYASVTRFSGRITNFHFVKGTALYTSAFTPGLVTAGPNTKLLLLATDSSSFLTDSSPTPRTVTNVNSSTFSMDSPFPSSAAPVNTVVPSISGTARAGQVVTASTGTWTGDPTPAYTYQWKSSSTVGGTYSNISGATSSSYTVAPNDVNQFLKVQVTATNSVAVVIALSSATTSVTAAPVNTVAPVITGAAQIGQTISASNGTWTGNPTPTFTYQWKVSSSVGGTYSNISGASSSTYVVASGDLNKFIKVEVTATNTVSGVTELSAATSVVSAIPTTTTSSTSTTLAPVVEIVVNAPTTTVAVGQGSIATIAPSAATIPAVSVTTPRISVTPTTATTIASRDIATTTTVAIPVLPAGPVAPPAPKIGAVAAGEVGVRVGDKTEKATVERVNNQYVVSVGPLKATIAPMSAGGGVAPLDSDGNIRLLNGSKVKITMNGFQPGSTLEAWLFSTPALLGTAKVGRDGSVTGTFSIPKTADDGAHRIALVAKANDGKPTTFTVGVMVGEWDSGPNVTLWLIVLPIVLAVGGALAIPATRRRRLRAE